VDCKATVKIGGFSRGGQTRGDDQAFDHDLGCQETYTPCGIVDEDSSQLDIVFGSSYKTSDFLVDTLEAKWDRLTLQRHFRVLTKFAHVESRLSGRQRPTEVVFYAPLNLCDRRACSASVAVGLLIDEVYFGPFCGDTIESKGQCQRDTHKIPQYQKF
jgi:hypothetical protein